jgi:hypothetical protein
MVIAEVLMITEEKTICEMPLSRIRKVLRRSEPAARGGVGAGHAAGPAGSAGEPPRRR